MSAPERRATIVRAAREEFAGHGFHGAGTAAIARRAGCSEAMLYRHFPSKKALLAAVFEEEVWGGGPGASPRHPLRPDPSLPLPDLLEARLADPETVTSARLILLAMSLSEDPEIGPVVARAFGTVRARLKAVIEAAQAGGAMRADIDAEQLTWIWHGLLLVAAVRRSISDDGFAIGAVDAARVLGRLLQTGR